MSASSPHLSLNTTPQIFKQSFLLFSSNFHTFLIFSLLLFSFKATVQTLTLSLTNFIDTDPSVGNLLSQLSDRPSDLPATVSTESFRFSSTGNRPRRRPILHISRIGTPDDDFFFDEEDVGRRRFPSNASIVRLNQFLHLKDKIGSQDSDIWEGIGFTEVSNLGFLFPPQGFLFSNLTVNEKDGENQYFDYNSADLGFSLSQKDAKTLFFLVGFLSAIYSWLILGFLFTFSAVLGVVFYVVMNFYLQRHNSILRNFTFGSKLGIRKLSSFLLLRWAFSDALTQLLGLWFFANIEDQYSLLKLFVRLKLLPFSSTFPGIHEKVFQKEISLLIYTWSLIDTLLSFVLSVQYWIAVMDVRSGREIMKEGFYLMSLMLYQAVQIKFLELIFCGTFVRLILNKTCGKLTSLFFQSVAEVFFMVVWLVFYLATRSKDAECSGQRFGRRNLEDFMNGLS